MSIIALPPAVAGCGDDSLNSIGSTGFVTIPAIGVRVNKTARRKARCAFVSCRMIGACTFKDLNLNP